MKQFIFLIAIYISNAFATVESGNSFLKGLQSGNAIERQNMLGYAAGMYDAYERIDPSIAKCLGSEVLMSQLVDALQIYLKNNPQVRHYPMFDIYPVAIKQTFKCK